MSNPDQMEMSLDQKAPKVTREDVERVKHFLEQGGDWMMGEALLRWVGWQVNDANRRKLRHIAEISEGEIASGPGAPGYKLTRLVSPDELRFIEGLKTQSDRMRNRYVKIMSVWHKRK